MKPENLFSDTELATLLFIKMARLQYKQFDRELLELTVKEIMQKRKYQSLLQHCTEEHPLGSGISLHSIMRNIYSTDNNYYYLVSNVFSQEYVLNSSYEKMADKMIKSYIKKQKIKSKYEKKLGY